MKKTKQLNRSLSYDWKLETANFTKDKGKVFTCFSCGGGSDMGYELAGFDVIGYNEIDPKMSEAYNANLTSKYQYVEPIQEFKKRKKFPKKLYKLDILGGSPPCSSFSLAGNREADWGKNKKFKEGQAEQVLDTLFFDFIDVAKILQPKIVIAENVKGLLQGAATKYLAKIYKEFDNAGYYCEHWLLNAAKMGVPQTRQRVFFVCIRKDIAEPFIYKKGFFKVGLKLDMNFNEREIPIKDFVKGKPKTEKQNYLPNRFGDHILNINESCPTLTTIDRYFLDKDTLVDDDSISKIGSFPSDYVFPNMNKQYLIGMSVPPIVMAKISLRIYDQILKHIK
jgi:DNA (cytosine-5)-methyltransferase 1